MERNKERLMPIGMDASQGSLLDSFLGALIIALGATMIVVVMSAATSGPSLQVSGAALLFTEEPRIVAKELLTGVCTDYMGQERGDLESWTSASGACDEVICHVEPSGNYTVSQTCRETVPYENPDTSNCVWISNSTLAYPDCCPQLSCAEASPLSTVDPLLCYDLASAFACSFWYNLTSGCNDTTANMYNESRIYCQSTCGLC